MNTLQEFIQNQKINDTHEHIISPETLKKNKRGLIELLSNAYLMEDIMSAGAPGDVFREDGDDEARWRRVYPYLKRTCNTTFYTCLVESLNDLYDLDIREIDDSNWEILNEKLLQSAAEGASWYDEVLHKKGNIDRCMLDMDRETKTEIQLWQEKGFASIYDTHFDERFFTKVARTDILLNVVNDLYKKEIYDIYGVDVKSFGDIGLLVEAFGRRAADDKAVCFKSVAAYFRTLYFENVSTRDAEKAFNRLDKNDPGDIKCVQDYIIHLLIRKAREMGLPFQFHTGMQALNENWISNCNPLHLNNLFIQYPDVTFVMLHGGYPFAREAGVMAKKFINVLIDFSYITQISVTATRNILGEWLELVPMTKITWGGDCRHVENSYAAVILLRKILSEVLNDKVDRNIFNEKKAIAIAGRIMHDNAAEIFQLG